ncbi:hypothetical protein DVH24_033665 [Malus domestica]|uniref:Protein kinase domain-containing protein n=1 Tax=Malus domestica TaxID=3750 RepID=A0A498HRN8_MALDO|nr:hypothetical protein DVH24_033665 [Malus domestica]
MKNCNIAALSQNFLLLKILLGWRVGCFGSSRLSPLEQPLDFISGNTDIYKRKEEVKSSLKLCNAARLYLVIALLHQWCKFNNVYNGRNGISHVRDYRPPKAFRGFAGTNDAEKWAKTLNDSSLNFKYSTIEKATGSFDIVNKLGQGGFGTVYKGVLADGREIAVKRLFFNNRHRAADFYNEINIISSVEHKNLVRLLGCCCAGPESLLVYEYLPNRSLDRFIFEPDSMSNIFVVICRSKIDLETCSTDIQNCERTNEQKCLRHNIFLISQRHIFYVQQDTI